MTDFPMIYPFSKMATLNIVTRGNCCKTDLLNFKINIGMDIIQIFSMKAKYCQTWQVMAVVTPYFEFDKAHYAKNC